MIFNRFYKKTVLIILTIILLILSLTVYFKFSKTDLISLVKANNQTLFVSFYNMVYKERSSVISPMNLPEFQLILSRKDIAHFHNLYKDYDVNDYSSIEKYQKKNQWRKAKLFYQGKNYQIKVKSHGKSPQGHKKGKFISLSIKLKDNQQIYQTKRFNLIIYTRVGYYYEMIKKYADYFNIMMQEDRLVSVKINNWDSRLYFFEFRQNDAEMERLNKSSYRIFSYGSDKSLVNPSDSFNKNTFYENFSSVLLENGYSENAKQSIFDYYLSINKDINQINYDAFDQYFDFDYITSFEAARTLAGFSGHGFTHGNLIMYYDTASSFFYPSFHRDNRLQTLNLNSSLESQLIWFEPNNVNRFLLGLSKNDLIRQEKYKKLYNFITKNDLNKLSNEFLLTRYNDDNLSYKGLLKFTLQFFGLSKYTDYIDHNSNVIKTYLEKSEPKMSFSKNDNNLFLEIQPNSMSGLSLSKLSLPNYISNSFFLFTYEDSKLVEKKKYSNLEKLKKLVFSNTLDNKGDILNRKYLIVFESINSFDDIEFQKNNLKIKNNITNKVLDFEIDSNLKVYDLDFSGLINHKNELDSFIKEHSNLDLSLDKDNNFILKSGVYQLYNDLIFPNNKNLIIEAGTKLSLAEDVSIVIYGGLEINGTESNPVVINSINPKEPFGSIGVLGNSFSKSKINYLHLSNGKERWINNIYFSAALSVHYNDSVLIKNSIIRNNNADDGVNIKYSNYVKVEKTLFENNFADQIDLDYCQGIVIDSKFLETRVGDTNGDGLDISGSKLIVQGSTFSGFKDKGISVGENSKIIINGNKFYDNNNSIAIKDLSIAYINNNLFKNNKLLFNAYQKKRIFGGSKVFFSDNNKFAKKSFLLDEISTVKFLEKELFFAIDLFLDKPFNLSEFNQFFGALK